MPHDPWPTHGDFTTQARVYAQARPGYPDALLQRLIRHVGVKPGDPVADVGAGTGLFTAQLAAHGLRVHAVEPNAAMRGQAQAIPGVIWHDGTFEAIPLPDHAIAWMTAAQSFHWADRPAALAQAARLLKPGGHLTVLWNRRLYAQHPQSPSGSTPDNLPASHQAMQWTLDALARHVPGFQDIHQETDWSAELVAGGHFQPAVYMEEAHVVSMSAERYLDLWRSHNHLAVAAGPARLTAFLDELADHLGRQHLTVIDVPYLCQAWTARRA